MILRSPSARSHRALAAALALTTSLVIAPSGFASGGVVLALFGASASDGCGSACGCHDHGHGGHDHDAEHASAGHGDADPDRGGCPGGCGDAHKHAPSGGPDGCGDQPEPEPDHAPGGHAELDVDPGACPDGCGGDTDGDHWPCPEGCDGCACSATVGVARLTDPPPMLSRPASSARVAVSSATGHHGVLARIFKPPKRPQA